MKKLKYSKVSIREKAEKEQEHREMNTENGKSQRVETQTPRAGEKEKIAQDREDIQKEMQDKE